MSNRINPRAALLVGAFSLFTAIADAGPAERRGAREVTLPSGTLLPLTLDSYVASDTSRVESPVRAHLRRAVIVNGVEVLPAGTRLSGFVTEARQSARVKGRGRLGVPVHRHVGRQRPLPRVHVPRRARSARHEEEGRPDDGIPAGAGAIIGGIADGRKGAAIGSAVGGAAGTGVVLSTRGKDVRLGRGAAVAVRLLQPVRVVDLSERLYRTNVTRIVRVRRRLAIARNPRRW